MFPDSLWHVAHSIAIQAWEAGKTDENSLLREAFTLATSMEWSTAIQLLIIQMQIRRSMQYSDVGAQDVKL